MTRLSLLVLLAVSAAAHAQPVEPEPPRRTPFDQGRMGLGFGFGAQTTLGEKYYVLSGAFGYYVLDGVELGLGAAHQFGDPSITRATPSLRYVAQPLVGTSPLIPYVGVFTSRYFISEGIDDVSSVGARAGALFLSGTLILGLGIAVEHIVSACTEDCTSVYPDVTFSLSL